MPTISNLSSLTNITGTLIFPVVDLTSPIPNKRATLQQLKSWIEGNATVASVAGRIGDIVLTYQDIGGLSTIAHTGNYSDITGKPNVFPVATATSSVLGGVTIGRNINVTTSGTISVNTATTSSIGIVKIGTGISVSQDGTISTTPISSATVAAGLAINSGILSVNTASTSTFGGVIVGSGLTADTSGTINVNTATTTTSGTVVVGDGLYLNNIATVNLTTASSTVLGGIKAGAGVSITADGVMTVTTGNFALQTATSVALGGVKIGANINVAGDGTISLDGLFTDTFILLNSVSTSSFVTGNTGSYYQTAGVYIGRGTSTSAALIYSDNYYINTGTTAIWNTGTTGTTRGIWIVGQADTNDIYGATGLMVDNIRVSSTATELNIFGYNNSNTAVISVRGTTNYENRVTQDYHIPNKKYVDIKSTSTATSSALGAVRLGFGITALGNGTINVGTATAANYGLIKVGTGLAINDNSVSAAQTGILSVTTGTTSTIGGVRIGWPNANGLSINNSASTLTGIISILTATTTTIGGIKVGTGISINAGGFLNIAAATSSTLGGVTPGSNMSVDVNGALTYIGGTAPLAVSITSSTQATSTNSGALQVAGGVGIGGDLYVGGNITANKLTIQFTTVTTTVIQTDDVITTVNTTQSISTATGALQVAGGVGVGQNLYIGGNFALGVLSETLIRTAYTSSNNSKFLVRPGFDIAGGGTITSADTLQFNRAVAGVIDVNSSSIVKLPFVLQHFDNTATGIMVLPQSLFTYAVGSTSSGQVYITSAASNNIKHYIRVGDDTDNASVRIKADTTFIGTGTDATATNNGALVVSGGIGVSGSIYVGGTASSISTTTGALQVVGGVGIGGDLYLSGGNISGTNENNLTISIDQSAGFQRSINITGQIGYGSAGPGGAINITGGDGNSSIAGYGGHVNITGGDATGGIGFYGGNVILTGGAGSPSGAGPQGYVQVASTNSSVSTTTGALQVVGGVGIGGNIFIGGNSSIAGITTVTNITASTSTTTGALQVRGGVGIGGNLEVGGTGTQLGNFYSQFSVVPVNFSNTPVYTTSTTVSDSRARVGAIVIVTPSATTGTNILGGDELEMDNFTVAASVTTNGIINLYVTALPGPVKGQRNFNYILG